MSRLRPARLRLPALAAGALGVVLCGLCAWWDAGRLLHAYLFAWWFFFGISMGALAVLMIHRLTGGPWGPLVEPALAAAAQAVPLMALLFLPILLFHGAIYPWVHPAPAELPLIQAKAWYLNRPFFCARAVVYFLLWSALAWRMRRAPAILRDSAEGMALGRISIAGLILYAFTMSLAAVDWIASLTPAWYSSTFGLLAMVGQMLSGFAFAVFVAGLSIAPTGEADRQHLQDLGNLLLVFVMTWAYLAYTQYLIIWAENLPAEISWYLPRINTDWHWVGAALIAFHFALPFCALLFRTVKRDGLALAWVAGALLLMHWVDAYWMVLPSVDGLGITPRLADLAATVGIGGFWLAVVLRALGRYSPAAPAAAAAAQEELKHA